MPQSPRSPRAHVFLDGQNLFHAAREAFGYTYPNYDPLELAIQICGRNNWRFEQAHFYTGVPLIEDDPLWNRFWSAKLLAVKNDGARRPNTHTLRPGITVFSRSLRYRSKEVRFPDGSTQAIRVGEEKGVDIRMALDVIRLAHEKAYSVAIIVSQDQDFVEVAKELRSIAREQNRWIKLVSAFPMSSRRRNTRGIDRTDWLPIDQQLYDSCIDRHDYRS